ncbi:MAG TPA: NADPH:quinone reductase [Hyphomicrobiaceae bacterium]|nr:NADPH:quinone reductase [Hyphomicrobiaceae bacterium]
MTGTGNTRMRAAWYERMGPAREVMMVGELAIPEPGHGEVLIQVEASGVNPHDTKRRSGWLGPAMYAPRVVPHSDGAGTVAALGPCVRGLAEGDRVFVYRAGSARPGEGTAAEYVAIPEANAIRLPERLSFAQGACLGVPAFTAYHATLADGPVSGQTVLVQGGAGAVGVVAVELARWSGARVIATVSSPEKAAIAKTAGADHVIDYTREDVAARVMEITGGAGVERIVEVDFGANVAIDGAVIAENGTVASYSSTRVREPVLPYYAFGLKGVRLHFVQGMNMPRAIREAAARTIVALTGRGMLMPRIAATFALGDIAAAHECVEGGRAIGNVVVEP